MFSFDKKSLQFQMTYFSTLYGNYGIIIITRARISQSLKCFSNIVFRVRNVVQTSTNLKSKFVFFVSFFNFFLPFQFLEHSLQFKYNCLSFKIYFIQQLNLTSTVDYFFSDTTFLKFKIYLIFYTNAIITFIENNF